MGVTEPAVYVSAAELMAEALRGDVPSDEFVERPFLKTRSRPDLLPRADGNFHTPSGKSSSIARSSRAPGSIRFRRSYARTRRSATGRIR
jgi:hypothetical protein